MKIYFLVSLATLSVAVVIFSSASSFAISDSQIEKMSTRYQAQQDRQYKATQEATAIAGWRSFFSSKLTEELGVSVVRFSGQMQPNDPDNLKVAHATLENGAMCFIRFENRAALDPGYSGPFHTTCVSRGEVILDKYFGL